MGIANSAATGPVSARVRETVMGAVLFAMFAGLGLCWVIASPAGPSAVSVPATLGVAAGVLLVGLGGLPYIGPDPSMRVVGGVGVVLIVAVLVTAWMRTADQAGVSPGQVSVRQFGTVIGSGTADLIQLVAAVLIVAVAVLMVTGTATPPVPVVAVLAGIGLLAGSVVGHPGTHSLGPLLVGIHALAAAWWCGTLAAMVLTVRGRSGWAATLPAFSARALWVVAVLVVTGVLDGLIEIGGPAHLLDNGYGRVLIAKAVGAAVLIVLGARHRGRWVPAADRHRMPERTSLRLAAIELLVMGVVLGLAVGLSTTAP